MDNVYGVSYYSEIIVEFVSWVKNFNKIFFGWYVSVFVKEN